MSTARKPERATRGSEPQILVGLVDGHDEVAFRLLSPFRDARGETWPEGSYRASRQGEGLVISGPRKDSEPQLELRPTEPGGRFCVEATIGIDFHWQQQEEQTFDGGLHLSASAGGLSAVNEVELETYLTSVICSEMSAESPPALLRAHAVVSRSWLLAQLRDVLPEAQRADPGDAHIRWYDREAHQRFDVCADDHCQRYQGLTRIASDQVAQAVRDTRGQVLSHGGDVCDARFSKCCGGVTEDFSAAWSDVDLPYLKPVADSRAGVLPQPSLRDEAAMRRFVLEPPEAYCHCSDAEVLRTILPSYDQRTGDFFRWQVELEAEQASELIEGKARLGLGRLLAMEPVERGLSGRLTKLRLRGEGGSTVVGKELEIRRLLSPSHLYSSAFVVDTEGPAQRPTAFVLRGAGWGHGVGLCQIGAAVMATQELDHQAILAHYYPGSALEGWYE